MYTMLTSNSVIHLLLLELKVCATENAFLHKTHNRIAQIIPVFVPPPTLFGFEFELVFFYWKHLPPKSSDQAII